MDDFTILLTARSIDDHFRVDFNRQAASLPCAALQALVKLVCARIETKSGLVHIECLTICRLRKELDKVRPGLGKQLIVHSIGEWYYLAIPQNKIRKCVAVAACFFDLEKLKLITPEQVKVLRKGCRKGKVRELDKWSFRKSRRKRKETKRKPSGN